MRYVDKLDEVTHQSPMTWGTIRRNWRKRILHSVFWAAPKEWIRQMAAETWDNLPSDVRNELTKVNWFQIISSVKYQKPNWLSENAGTASSAEERNTMTHVDPSISSGTSPSGKGVK